MTDKDSAVVGAISEKNEKTVVAVKKTSKKKASKKKASKKKVSKKKITKKQKFNIHHLRIGLFFILNKLNNY